MKVEKDMKRLNGIVCANITPMNSDGSIDYAAMRHLTRYLVKSGIHGLFSNGSNGEGILLSLQERMRLAELIVNEVKGRIPVVIQCGAQNVNDTIALASNAAAAGADGIGVMTPYFFRQNDEALYHYYLAAAQAVPDTPVYIYNIPSHTNNDMQPALVSRLHREAPNITGIKYSHADLLRLDEYLHIDDSFDAFIGCDRLLLPALSQGAAGGISGPVAVYPELFVSLWQSWQRQDLVKTRFYQQKIIAAEKCLAAYSIIPMIKTYLFAIGLIGSNFCRSPFQALSGDESRQLLVQIEELNKL